MKHTCLTQLYHNTASRPLWTALLVVTGLCLSACFPPDNGCMDRDGDGYSVGNTCTDDQKLEPYTCDANADSYPGQAETCDGQDNNCDGSIDESPADAMELYADIDGDGHGNAMSRIQSCSMVRGYVTSGDDCDDLNPQIYAGALEVCNGVDDDCNAQIDDGTYLATWYPDRDRDGYGTTNGAYFGCQGSGYTDNALDCNDAASQIYPGAPEVCDQLDNNCDGQLDEGVERRWYYPDQDGDGFGDLDAALYLCSPPSGYSLNALDCDDSLSAVNPDAAEVCDGMDNNCNGQADEGLVMGTFYLDEDGDGFGSRDHSIEGCASKAYVGNSLDCNDQNAAQSPASSESCNGRDDNCDGTIDEGVQSLWYLDRDGDGYGTNAATTLACTLPAGYAAQAGDCNDGQVGINPSAMEGCDTIDNNCDGRIDENQPVLPYYLDGDGDGFGQTASSVMACQRPLGYVSTGGDCNDNNPLISPIAAEHCNGIDDNCDGQLDETYPLLTWYRDGDADGYGTSTVLLSGCAQPIGYVTIAGDCNDQRNDISPAASERCNDLDDNCDGQRDEGLTLLRSYRDVDGDLYGYSADYVDACARPGGYVSAGGDCNDGNAQINPSGTERCNGQDDDCDTAIDEGVTTLWYPDADGDGYGATVSPIQSCQPSSGIYASVTGDCDDSNPEVHPGQADLLNAQDDDCDGWKDEDVPPDVHMEYRKGLGREPGEAVQYLYLECPNCGPELSISLDPAAGNIGGEPLEVEVVSNEAGLVTVGVIVPRGATLGDYTVSVRANGFEPVQLIGKVEVFRGETVVESIDYRYLMLGSSDQQTYVLEGWNFDGTQGGNGPQLTFFLDALNQVVCVPEMDTISEQQVTCTIFNTKEVTKTGRYEVQVRDGNEDPSTAYNCAARYQDCSQYVTGVQ